MGASFTAVRLTILSPVVNEKSKYLVIESEKRY